MQRGSSLVPMPTPSFSKLHAEKLGVDLGMRLAWSYYTYQKNGCYCIAKMGGSADPVYYLLHNNNVVM